MTKFVAISTSVTGGPDRMGRMMLAHRTVAVDENGRAWEFFDNGVLREWRPMPTVDEAAKTEAEAPVPPLITN